MSETDGPRSVLGERWTWPWWKRHVVLPGDIAGIGRSALAVSGLAAAAGLSSRLLEHGSDVTVFSGVVTPALEAATALLGAWALGELTTLRRGRALFWATVAVAGIWTWTSVSAAEAWRWTYGFFGAPVIREYASVAGATAWFAAVLLLLWRRGAGRPASDAGATQGPDDGGVLSYARPGAPFAEPAGVAQVVRGLLVADVVLYGAVRHFGEGWSTEQLQPLARAYLLALTAAYVLTTTAMLFGMAKLLRWGVAAMAAVLASGGLVPTVLEAGEGGRPVLENVRWSSVASTVWTVVTYAGSGWLCWLILRRGNAGQKGERG